MPHERFDEAGLSEYVAVCRPFVGTTMTVSVEPSSDPLKCAGGGGSIDTGPISIRYVPSTSNVPSSRIVGRGKTPWPQPAVILQLSETVRHAPLPLHLPSASGPACGAFGFPPHENAVPISATRTNGLRRLRQ